MNVRQAQRLSSVSTAVRTTKSGEVVIWIAGEVPVKRAADGALWLDYTAIHYLHFEDDWRPVKPVVVKEAPVRSNEQVPRFDLIDSIRQQIADGTYITDAKLETALQRMLQE